MNHSTAGKGGSALTIRVVFAGVMAAIVYVVTFFRIPFLYSQVHFANSMCLLSGLLLGPVWGGAAAGLGSALYDVVAAEYGFFDALITFVTKAAMAWIAGMLFRNLVVKKGRLGLPWQRNLVTVILCCAAGALGYVALYIFKSWMFALYVNPIPADTIPAVLWGKLVPSLINALFAVITAPVFYHAVRPPLKAAGLLPKITGEKP